MSKIFIFILILVSSLLSLEAVLARESASRLTLRECIEKALAIHPDLKNAEAQMRAARAVIGQAVSAYYPQVNFTSSYSRSGGPDRTTNVSNNISGFNITGTGIVSNLGTTFSDSLVLQQYITDFGKTPDLVTASQESYSAILYDLLATKNTIENSVKKAYYNCIAGEELLNVKRENVTNSESHLRQSEAFYSVGRRAKIEVTKSEVDLANARLDLIKADNAYSVSKITLINAIGLDKPIDFELSRELTLPEISLPFSEILKITSESRPEFLKAESQIRAQKANVKAAIAGFYPSITASAQYNWRGSEYPLERFWQLGMTLALPITDGNLRTNVVRENQARLDGLVAQKERLWQNISFEVEKAYLAMKEARERINVSEKTLSQAEENFKLAKGRYNVGVGSNLEYTDAQVALLQAKTDYISALVDYFNAIADLEKSAGVEMKKSEGLEIERLRSKDVNKVE